MRTRIAASHQATAKKATRELIIVPTTGNEPMLAIVAGANSLPSIQL